MNVMRLNFSHGDFAEHQGKVDNLKKAIKKTGIPCAIMQDLSGPKFRLGDFYQERVQLRAGDFIILTTDKIVGDEKRVPWIERKPTMILGCLGFLFPHTKNPSR